MGLFDLDNKFMKDYLKDYTNYSNWYGNTIRAEPMIDKNSIKKHLDDVWDALFARLDKKYRKNLFIAGGCFQSLALGEPVNDYDVFCNEWKFSRIIHEELTKKFASSLTENNKCLYFYAGDYQINFVKNVFGTPEVTINQFDFAHCMSFYTAEGQLQTGQIGNKVLQFNERCSNVIGSIYRLKKFLSRGYSIHSSEIKKIFKKATDSVDTLFGSDTNINKEWFGQFSSFYQGNE